MAKSIKLHTGQEMPMLGMGTWHHGPKEEIQGALRFAIRNGYRHIDCAHIYLNEKEVGEVFAEMIGNKEIKREDLFIGSKLWGTHHEPKRVEEGFKDTLKALQLDYLDLYYIHWPSAFEYGDGNLPKDSDGRIRQLEVDFLDTWKEMEKLVDQGLVKALGLCNFNTKQMNKIFDNCKIRPAVLQVESNPRIHNEIIRKFCVQENMAMIGYSSFGSPDLPWGEKLPHILVDPVIVKIAEKHGKSTALIVLRWQIQRGVALIPKSIIEKELLENLKAHDFKLDQEDMAAFESLDKHIRKIVPIVKLANGEVELRDEHSSMYPFRKEDEETEECLKKK